MNTKNWRSCWQHGFSSTLKTSSGRGPATERTRSLAENAAFLSQSRASLSSQSSSLLLSTVFVAPTSTSNPRQLWFFGIHYPLWFCFKKFRLLEEQLFARTLSPPLFIIAFRAASAAGPWRNAYERARYAVHAQYWTQTLTYTCLHLILSIQITIQSRTCLHSRPVHLTSYPGSSLGTRLRFALI